MVKTPILEFILSLLEEIKGMFETWTKIKSG